MHLQLSENCFVLAVNKMGGFLIYVLKPANEKIYHLMKTKRNSDKMRHSDNYSLSESPKKNEKNSPHVVQLLILIFALKIITQLRNFCIENQIECLQLYS